MICRLKTNLANDDLTSGTLGTVCAVKRGERKHYGTGAGTGTDTGADWLNYSNNGTLQEKIMWYVYVVPDRQFN